MEALKQMLTQADDEYLTGLCNKGTVKRAYKDLDQEPPGGDFKRGGMHNSYASGGKYLHLPLAKHLPSHYHSNFISEKQPKKYSGIKSAGGRDGE